MIFSDFWTYLILLPNNDLVMMKFGPRFELFDHLIIIYLVENIVKAMENTNT